MTYYDELGVTPDASAEEIREAYRKLVRLLHPDKHQANQELQRLADLQLKRLNEIVGILGDPEQRREYDRSLLPDEPSRPVAPPPSRKAPPPPVRAKRSAPTVFEEPTGPRHFVHSLSRAFNSGMWILTFVIGAGALGWYFATETDGGSAARPDLRPDATFSTAAEASSLVESSEDRGRSSRQLSAAPKPSSASPSRVELSRVELEAAKAVEESRKSPQVPEEKLRDLERRLRQARIDREAALADAERQFAEEMAALQREATRRPVPTPENSSLSRAESPKVAQAAESKAAPAAAAGELQRAQAQPAPSSPMQGRWAYRPAPKKKDDGLFPPEFIEMTIEVQGDVVWGNYKARYSVPPNRKIHPEVQFQFIGKPTRKSPQFLWSGEGGATGVVELKFVNNSSVEVNWTATNMGKVLGLVAGTAILERQP